MSDISLSAGKRCTRREFLAASAAGAVSLSLYPLVVRAEEAKNEKPNILLIISDEHNAGVLGCYGNSVIKTPNLDSISRIGVTFDACYCNSPLCVPSRESFISGKYISRYGVWSNNCELPSDDVPSVPRLLNEAGYESFLCGKMHLAAGRNYGYTQIGSFNNNHKSGKGNRRKADDLEPSSKLSGRFDEFHAGDNSHVLDHDKKVTEGTLDFLKKRGFFVCNRSLSNYGQTLFSFASSLNLNLIPDLRISKDRAPSDRKMLSWFIRRNFVSSYLKKCGYRIFHLVPEYAGISANSAADITLKGQRLFLKQWVLNDFNNMLIHNSFLLPLLKFIPIENALYRDLVLETFQELKEAAPQKGPKFVFCYIPLPHPPFVFEADGTPNKQTTQYFMGDGSMYEGSPASYRDGYRKQIQFVNKKLKKLIAYILDHSPSDPVIILQSDHGPGNQLNWENPAASNMKERLAILNAYYLPIKNISLKNHERIPADDMTPVNSFRFIFNLYFNTDYPMIKSQSCLASWRNPFNCYFYAEPENKSTSQDNNAAF